MSSFVLFSYRGWSVILTYSIPTAALLDNNLSEDGDAMAKKFQFSNVYIISFLATLGGLMQGFDVASMSAIIGTKQVSLEKFRQSPRR